jgi:hypothetical protein
MKKLLLTTAIAGVMVSGSAFAQTSITGELRLNYKTVSDATAANGATSPGGIQGFGQEQQINIQTKGKLNVLGLDYAAGMSLENDGAQATTLFNENTYMDFTNASSGTTISFSRDHIQRSDSDRSAAVLVGFSPNELSSDGPVRTIFSQNIGPSVGQATTASILQKTPFGTLSYSYAPTGNAVQTATGSTSPISQTSENTAENDEKSAYEYGFTGDLGVKGLNTYYFKSEQKRNNASAAAQVRDSDARSLGVSYNFGQFSVGYADKKYNFMITPVSSTGATAGTNDIKEKHYGVAYAVDKNLSIGAIYAKGDFTGSVVDQKTKGVNLGYNLGPVAMTVGYAKNTDVGGTSGVEHDIGMVRFIGAF